MSSRTIKLLAIVNVVAAAGLFVWFNAIPPQSSMAAIAQQYIDADVDGDPSFRLEMTTAMRDAWEYRTRQYAYWATVAGAVILMNAGVAFWNLLRLEVGEVPPNQALQLTGDARG